MKPIALPAYEAERLASVRSYDVLDTAAGAGVEDLASVAARLTGCPLALVSMMDTDPQYFRDRFGADLPPTPRESAFCAHALAQPGWLLVVPDAAADPRFAANPLVSGPPGIRFYAGAALLDRHGHALGTLCVIDYQPRELPADQREGLAALARAVASTLELRQAAGRLREMALTDALTGLANRPAFFGALDRAIARQRHGAEGFGLVCVDLDGFKSINDRYGHSAGDLVLGAAAQSLLACTRREDVVARIGGDEFAVLVVGGDGRDVRGVAERIRLAILRATAASGAAVSASVGAAMFDRPPDDSVAALVAADRLLYAAKGAGKDRTAYGDIAGR
jgi:diguanylate cyclase (GGDEF)-like protein